jgi:serine/threonine-protein kinase haspin
LIPDPDTTTSSITTSTTASASPSPSPLARGVSPALEPVPGLEPLIEAHRVDTGKDISVLDWLAILPPSSSITKIAEASYAEVYRITASAGSSIIKIMQLQVPSDEASYEIETANAVENVVSEIRIMNALTEVPGYVTFKGTYIVQGPPPKAIIDAYTNHLETYQEDEGSYFPHPETDFNANSTFLVLELGDAGEVLENIPIVHLNQVWDLFLGVVLAVSRAEITNEFEVCESQSPQPSHLCISH